ncbi:MAG: DegV family protein [Erysipelothrix sp.]|nr:DegV family protein [Erysipelothrix sp.]
MKIKIMIDSAADISKEMQEKENIAVARFALTVDGKQYIDEEEISLDEFKKFLAEERDVSTSQASIGLLMEMFDEFLKEYDHVIYLTLSRKLSGSYQSAYALSQEYEGRVTVIDGNVVATPMQNTYHAIKRYVEQGKSVEEIKEAIENHEPMYAHIVPFDIKHLKKGGRISSQAAALANLLKITPILSLKDGVIDAHDKVRTRKKAVQKAVNELIKLYPNANEYHWYILQSDLDEEAQEYADYIKTANGETVEIFEMYPLILTHTGPKTIVIGTQRKYPETI